MWLFFFFLRKIFMSVIHEANQMCLLQQGNRTFLPQSMFPQIFPLGSKNHGLNKQLDKNKDSQKFVLRNLRLVSIAHCIIISDNCTSNVSFFQVSIWVDSFPNLNLPPSTQVKYSSKIFFLNILLQSWFCTKKCDYISKGKEKVKTIVFNMFIINIETQNCLQCSWNSGYICSEFLSFV